MHHLRHGVRYGRQNMVDVGTPNPPAPIQGAVAIIPLKALSTAKSRLAPALSRADRRELTVRMFHHVVQVCRATASVSSVVVLAGDREGVNEVDSLVPRSGATVTAMLQPEHVIGLNAAVAYADARLSAEVSIVVAADLPLATSHELESMIRMAGTHAGVLVAATTDGGTGALLRRPGNVIPPAYGPGSCAQHLRLAAQADVRAGQVHLPGFAADVDRPGDLVYPSAMPD